MKPITPDEITRLAAEIRQDPERLKDAFEKSPDELEDLLWWLLAALPDIRRLSVYVDEFITIADHLEWLPEAGAEKILQEAEHAREEAACDAAASRREARRR